MSEVPKKMIFLPLEIKQVLQLGNRKIMRYFKRLAVIVAFISTTYSASSQTLEVGLFGGGSYYLGEMNSAMHFSETQLAYGVLARLNLNER